MRLLLIALLALGPSLAFAAEESDKGSTKVKPAAVEKERGRKEDPKRRRTKRRNPATRQTKRTPAQTRRPMKRCMTARPNRPVNWVDVESTGSLSGGKSGA